MSENWIDSARNELVSCRHPSGGWGYRRDTSAMAEPTVLASLGLLATSSGLSNPDDALAREAAGWLASIQRDDGGVGLSAELCTPCWPTALAVILWTALDDCLECRAKAVNWLLTHEGKLVDELDASVIGHNATLRAWPWVLGTCPWLEPTAMAVIALRLSARRDHPRTQEAVEMICDRALRTGGWNFGNTTVFGKEYHAEVAPTGWALVALAGLDVSTKIIHRACAFLEKGLSEIRSPWSLAWSILGLQAWGRRPEDADQLLEQCCSLNPPPQQEPIDLAHLLLAATDTGLGFFTPSSSLAGPSRSVGRRDYAPTPEPSDCPSELS